MFIFSFIPFFNQASLTIFPNRIFFFEITVFFNNFSDKDFVSNRNDAFKRIFSLIYFSIKYFIKFKNYFTFKILLNQILRIVKRFSVFFSISFKKLTKCHIHFPIRFIINLKINIVFFNPL